eukprot:3667741-Pleurochrysis_carterae.AAC.3
MREREWLLCESESGSCARAGECSARARARRTRSAERSRGRSPRHPIQAGLVTDVGGVVELGSDFRLVFRVGGVRPRPAMRIHTLLRGCTVAPTRFRPLARLSCGRATDFVSRVFRGGGR